MKHSKINMIHVRKFKRCNSARLPKELTDISWNFDVCTGNPMKREWSNHEPVIRNPPLGKSYFSAETQKKTQTKNLSCAVSQKPRVLQDFLQEWKFKRPNDTVGRDSIQKLRKAWKRNNLLLLLVMILKSFATKPPLIKIDFLVQRTFSL